MTVIISLNSHHDTLPELENATAATAITIGSRALSFSGPLLSVDVEFCGCVGVFVCLSATLRSNISETKGARAKVTMGS